MRRFVPILLLLLAGCAAAPPQRREPRGAPPVVRVKIAAGDRVRIGGEEPFLVTDGIRGREVREGECHLSVNSSGIRMTTEKGGDIRNPTLPIWAYALAETGKVLVNGKPYRGTVVIRQDSTGSLLALNEVDLESYLLGVVPAEIGTLDPGLFEALKAQAIAARTYALKRLEEPGEREKAYDLESTVMDQVYLGASGETPLGNRSVRETRGEVMRYRGQSVSAYYSSCCGGHTADIEESWDKPPEAYLKGTKDIFCREAKNFSWSRAFSRDQVQMMLDAFFSDSLPPGWKGYPGRWKSLRVLKRGSSGRVLELLVTTDFGKRVLSKGRIRWVLVDLVTKAILPSTLFTLRMDEAGVTLSGNGNGHGVGMCQQGALGMARKGRKAVEILKHYYRGIRVERAYG